jgi:hypothetical protein
MCHQESDENPKGLKSNWLNLYHNDEHVNFQEYIYSIKNNLEILLQASGNISPELNIDDTKYNKNKTRNQILQQSLT